MTRVLLGDVRTGRSLKDLPVVTMSWEKRRNRAETVRATVDLLDPDVRALDLRSAATAGKSFLAVVENDTFMAAGQVWPYGYDGDTGHLDLAASGLWSYFDNRTVLPAGTTNPAGADTAYTALEFGTIAKRLVQQANGWAGAGLPIVFEADRVGTHDKTYAGIDLKIVGTVLQQLTQLNGGPDLEFSPRWQWDRLGVEWLLRTGTDAQPRLGAATIHRWDYTYGMPEGAVRNLKTNGDASLLASQAWATGGRSGDKTLVSRAVDTTLTDAGYPLLEAVDTTHSTVTDQATLDGYASELVRVGKITPEFWTFQVRADAPPLVGVYGIGDTVRLQVARDPYIRDGSYLMTIAALSGDQDGRWVKITGGEVTKEL